MLEWGQAINYHHVTIAMQIPLTSLVPTIVEVIQFIENNWPHIWWFPNWYLGLPLRFVTGPVVPLVVLGIHKISGFSVGTAYLIFVGCMWLVGGVGLKSLVSELGGGKKSGWLACLLFLMLPAHLFLLSYGNGLHHLTISMLSAIIFIWLKALKKWNILWPVLLILLISLTLLIDVGGILAVVVAGITVIFLGPRQDWLEGWVKLILVVLTAISIATIWYTPRFWWILLGNPSFGGKPLANVIPFILQLLQAIIPLLLGVWFVQKRYRLTDKLTLFGVLFGSSFLFLTLIRFLSDVDFWMDWTGYFLELQLAVSVLGGILLSRYIKRWYITLIIISILTISNGAIFFKLYKPNEKDSVYKKGILQMISSQVLPGSRVFLSGSPVFWLGAVKQNLLQVRGGRDEVSTHPTWAMGAYQIREGIDIEILRNWLSVFGVSELIYHSESSREPFKDFKNPERFKEFSEVISDSPNTVITFNAFIARRADPEITVVAKPKEGSDKEALAAYQKTLGDPLNFKSDARELLIEGQLRGDQVVS
ncbi:MAG: hypothetical protein AAB874_05600, partial [Patescibacteria group bacterium]